MAQETITIVLNAQAQTAGIRTIVGGLAQVKGAAESASAVLTGFATKVAGIAAGFVGFNVGVQALRNAIEKGVRFNQTLEDSRLGIAAVLKQFNPTAFKTFPDAMVAAGNALDLLKKKAVESPASFTQLVAGFQAISGAASSAGITLQNQVDLTVLMSQALAGLGIRAEQFVQESRSLITGNITEDSAIGKMLTLRKQDIDLARQQGRLYEFLRERLSAFAEAGKIGATNFSVAVSNLGDVVEQKLGAITVPIFEAIRGGVLRLTQALQEADLVGAFARVGESIAGVITRLLDLGRFAAENVGILKSSRFGEFLGLLVEAGLEEGFRRGAALGRSILERLFNTFFSVDFLIIIARAGKALAEVLMRAVKIPIDVLAAGFIWVTTQFYNQWVDTMTKASAFFVKSFTNAFNTLLLGSPALSLAFKPLKFDEQQFRQSIRQVAQVADQSFADIFTDVQKQTDDAIGNTLQFFDAQIEKTRQLLELGEIQNAQAEQRISATEKLKTLLQEVNAEQMGATEGGLTAADFQPRSNFDVPAAPRSKLDLQRDAEEERKQTEALIAQNELELQRLRTRGLIHEQTGRTVGTLKEEAQAIKETLYHIQALVQAKVDQRKSMVEQGLVSSAEAREMELRDARELLQIQQQLVSLKYELNDFTFVERLSEGLTALAEQFNNVGAAIADVLVSGIGGAIRTVSDGIWQVIDGTATWGQLFTQVGRQIISGLIQIAIQEIFLDNLKRGLMTAWATMKAAFIAKDVAMTNAGEAAKTPALAANATLASISSYGLAVVIGLAALAAVMATMGAFERGGVVDGGEQLIRVNERGTEAVLNAQATAMLGRDTINALNAGYGADALPPGGRAGYGGGGRGGLSESPDDRPINITVIVLTKDQRQETLDTLASAQGRVIVVDTVAGNKTEAGVS